MVGFALPLGVDGEQRRFSRSVAPVEVVGEIGKAKPGVCGAPRADGPEGEHEEDEADGDGEKQGSGGEHDGQGHVRVSVAIEQCGSFPLLE